MFVLPKKNRYVNSLFCPLIQLIRWALKEPTSGSHRKHIVYPNCENTYQVFSTLIGHSRENAVFYWSNRHFAWFFIGQSPFRVILLGQFAILCVVWLVNRHLVRFFNPRRSIDIWCGLLLVSRHCVLFLIGQSYFSYDSRSPLLVTPPPSPMPNFNTVVIVSSLQFHQLWRTLPALDVPLSAVPMFRRCVFSVVLLVICCYFFVLCGFWLVICCYFFVFCVIFGWWIVRRRGTTIWSPPTWRIRMIGPGCCRNGSTKLRRWLYHSGGYFGGNIVGFDYWRWLWW